MSTTVPVNIFEWAPSIDAQSKPRPVFANPVPAHVRAGGCDVGELDAHLAWEGDFLLARIELPALPGHVLRASCALHANLDDECGRPGLSIRIIDVTIDRLPERTSKAFRGAKAQRRADGGSGVSEWSGVSGDQLQK